MPRTVTIAATGPTTAVPTRMEHGLYFRQLLSGRDFAVGDPVATQMVNFVYAIGDRASGECVLVDPAYASATRRRCRRPTACASTGVLATHYHADHVGGVDDGLRRSTASPTLLEHVRLPDPRPARRGPWVTRTTGCAEADLAAHDPGDMVTVGEHRRSSSSTRPATRPAASASSSTAGWCPATRCSSTVAAAPTCPAATQH